MASDDKDPVATNGDCEKIVLEFPDFMMEDKRAVISHELLGHTFLRMNRVFKEVDFVVTPKSWSWKLTFGGHFMYKKYSYELKVKVVEEYLEGKYSYNALMAKYGISTDILIQRWVNSYQTFGKDSLRAKQGRTNYSLDFKRNVLHFK